MAHYFSKENNLIKSNPKVIAFRVNEIPLKLTTDFGVFSKDGLDRGTAVLLKYMDVSPTFKKALDLGCGYGVIGIYLSKKYNMDVDMVDINKRAVELATKNVSDNNVSCTVFESDGFTSVHSKYDLIVLNPPIRAGKKVYYKLFEESVKYLTDSGEFIIVINKKHGANSAIEKLNTIYNEVMVIGREKGFYIVRSKKHLTI